MAGLFGNALAGLAVRARPAWSPGQADLAVPAAAAAAPILFRER